MKVLHFINNLHGGGAEMMLCNLLEDNRAGVENVVVSLAYPSEHALVKRIEKAACKVHFMCESSFIKPRPLWKLIKLLRKERPDVLQSWLHKPDLVGGVLGKLCGAKPVWGIHSMDVTTTGDAGDWKARLFRKALGFVSRWGPAAIISCSLAAWERHLSWGYPAKKFQFIPNGVDTRRFYPNQTAGRALRVRLGIPAEAPVVGFVGRLAPVKDVPTFVAAAALLQQQMPDAHFIVCGDAASPQYEISQELRAKLPKPDQLHRLPFQADVENVYPALDLFALTSLSEAYPMVIIEAMACGVPCVSTNVGDSAELLRPHGETVPVGDAVALAAAWQRILVVSGEAREARHLAIVAKSEAFSLRKCTDNYYALYQRIV